MNRRVVLVLAALLLAGCGSSPTPQPSAATPSAAPRSAAPASSASATPSASAEASVDVSASSSPAVSDAPSPAASETATRSPSAQPPSAGPGAAALQLPDTPVTATIDQSYNTTGDPFNPAHLGGVEPGDVTARWYVAEDRWVVYFDGLDLEATGPLCPGSSIQTEAGFEHVSNAPTERGACDGFDVTLAADPVGVRRCGDRVLYLTAIPADVEGVLYASIETQYQTPGSVVGLTSTADATGGQAPEIELDDAACEVVPARP